MGAENRYTSADLMRKQNARSILQVIHNEKGIYRKMVAVRTNLAAQTVTNIITVLIDKGIVIENPLAICGKGRNPFALQINYAGFYIISVQISNFSIDIFFNNLESEVLYERHYEMDASSDALDVLKNAVSDIYDKYCKEYIISAVVISEAGIVDEKNGIVIEDYTLKWHNLNIRKELSFLEVPILVLNDVNIIAHYENSANKNNANFMVVKVDNGVGSALVLDNRVLYSSNRVSGEFGHITALKQNEEIQCFCGRKNCITQFISKGALKRRLKKSYAEIKHDVYSGVPGTRGIIEEIGSLIAPKLADFIVLLDLDRVILTGDVVEDFEDIIFPCIKSIIEKDISFWIPFNKLEVKKYDFFPKICSRYAIDFYFSAENDLHFLWDTYL